MLKFFKKNSFNYLYASLFLLFLFQFALETNKYCDNFTRLLSIGIVLNLIFFLKLNENTKINTPLISYISFLYSIFVLPRLFMLSYMPDFVKFPFEDITSTIINKGLVIFLLTTVMLYLGIFFGAKIWPQKKYLQEDGVFSFKAVSIILIINLMVVGFLNYFLEMSPYLHSVNSFEHNNFIQILKCFFSLDTVMFLTLTIFFSNQKHHNDGKWLFLTCITIFLFWIDSTLSGSRGGSLRILMQFIVVYLIVNKAYLKERIVFFFLFLIICISPITYNFGDYARKTINTTQNFNPRLVVKNIYYSESYYDNSSSLKSFEAIFNRLSIVDYAILLPYTPRNESLLKKYVSWEYIFKSTINSIYPGTLFQEAPLSTARAINVIYRKYTENFVLSNGYFSEFWTSFALLFFLFGLLVIPIHFFIGLGLQFGYTFFSKMKYNYNIFLLASYLYLAPIFILFTMGIDHTIQSILVVFFQSLSFFLIYKLATFFIYLMRSN